MGTDRFLRKTEYRAASGLYLHKNKYITLCCNNVDLGSPVSIVSAGNNVTVFFQIPGGCLFAFLACGYVCVCLRSHLKLVICSQLRFTYWPEV